MTVAINKTHNESRTMKLELNIWSLNETEMENQLWSSITQMENVWQCHNVLRFVDHRA